MAIPMLGRYRDVPFNEATRLDYIDFFTGNGTATDYALINKFGTEVGASAEVDGVLKPRETGAITIDGNTVRFASAPLNASQIIIPGSQALVFPVSDQDDALGRIIEVPFYIADLESIQFYTYNAQPGDAGIKLQFVKKVTADTAAASWFQLGTANPNGTVGSYQAAGNPLYTPPIGYADNLQANASSGATTCTVLSGSSFLAGDYILVNRAGGSEEIVKILSIAGNILTHTGFTNSHNSGESVIAIGRKLWAKITVPLNAVGGAIINLYGITLQVKARVTARS